MSKNQVDMSVRRLLLFSKIFTKSWGSPKNLKRVKHIKDGIFAKRLCMELVERANPQMIIVKDNEKNFIRQMEGHFLSPLAHHSPDLFQSENIKRCHWKGMFNTKNPVGTVILLASTGDHSYFLRQLLFANRLLQQSINIVLIENPFYGNRKPKTQFRSALENVVDLFIMGAALITECVFMFKWLTDRHYCPNTMGIGGVSLGGFNAGLVATNVTFPIAVVPCLSWTSAAPAFTQGALTQAINWKNLEAELTTHEFCAQLELSADCNWLEKLHTSTRLSSDFTLSQRFMWILMEEFTSLERFATPLHPELARFIIAGQDEYIKRDGVPDVREVWPGVDVQVLENTGHIQGCLQNPQYFCDGISEMLAKTEQVLKMEHAKTGTNKIIK